MQKENIKFESSTVLEGMTSIRALLQARKTGINNRPIERILCDRACEKKLEKELRFLQKMGVEHGFSIEATDSTEIDTLALGASHGGLLAICGERDLPRLNASISGIHSGFYVMIQGIEDPYNFGYALRSLYACGADGVVLCERNWLSAAGVVARASAGASELFPVYISEPEEAVSLFHAIGHTVVCADERTDNILGKTPLKKPLLLIVGGERRGISRAVLDGADVLVKIPYGRDFRASLSAASAATIMAYEIQRQNS